MMEFDLFTLASQGRLNQLALGSSFDDVRQVLGHYKFGINYNTDLTAGDPIPPEGAWLYYANGIQINITDEHVLSALKIICRDDSLSNYYGLDYSMDNFDLNLIDFIKETRNRNINCKYYEDPDAKAPYRFLMTDAHCLFTFINNSDEDFSDAAKDYKLSEIYLAKGLFLKSWEDVPAWC